MFMIFIHMYHRHVADRGIRLVTDGSMPLLIHTQGPALHGFENCQFSTSGSSNVITTLAALS